MSPCECCDHPLQHAIHQVIARYDAPIPRPTTASVIDELREAVSEFEETPKPLGVTETTMCDAWDAYCEYLKTFRGGDLSLTAPEFLWRWFAKP